MHTEDTLEKMLTLWKQKLEEKDCLGNCNLAISIFASHVTYYASIRWS